VVRPGKSRKIISSIGVSDVSTTINTDKIVIVHEMQKVITIAALPSKISSKVSGNDNIIKGLRQDKAIKVTEGLKECSSGLRRIVISRHINAN